MPDGESFQAPERGLTLIGPDAVVDAHAGSILRAHGPSLALERGGVHVRGSTTITTPFAVVVSAPDPDGDAQPADLTVDLTPQEPPMLKLAAVTALTGAAVTVAVLSGRALVQPTTPPAAPSAPVAIAAGQRVDLDRGGLRPTTPPKDIKHGVGQVAPVKTDETGATARVVFDPPCDDCLDVSATVPTKVDVSIGGSPAIGPESACVNIVVFTDYECPFCEKSLSTLHDLAALYPKDVRIGVKNLPLPMHPHAKLAAEAALAAQAQDKFWAMHDVMLANQESLTRDDLIKHAERLGLDVARFTADLDGHVYADEIDAEADLAKGAGVQGVPAFIMNGKMIQGARPLDVMKGMVDAELATCRAAR